MKIKHITTNYAHVILLIFLALFHFISNYYFLKNTTYILPYHCDEIFHLNTTLKLYHSLFSDFSLSDFALYLKDSQYQWPPFFPLFSALLNLILGSSETNSFFFTNSFLFIFIIFPTYAIGTQLTERSDTGLLAAFLVSMFPMTFGLSRFFLLEFTLIAIVTLCLYLILSHTLLKNFKKSILLGILLGIGLLTKKTFILFIIAPFLLNLVIEIKKIKEEKKLSISDFLRNVRFLNFSLILGIALLISLPWYLYFFLNISDKSFRFGLFLPLNGLSFKELTFYLKSLFGELSIINYFCLIFTPLYFLSPVIKSREKWTILLWLIVPYIFLSLLDNKEGRYISPILPALALIISASITTIPLNWLRKLLITLLILFSFEQYYDFTLNRYQIETIHKKNRSSILDETDSTFSNQLIKKTIEQSIVIPPNKRSKNSTPLLVGLYSKNLDLTFLEYESRLNNWNIEFINFYLNPEKFYQNLEKFKYLVIKTEKEEKITKLEIIKYLSFYSKNDFILSNNKINKVLHQFNEYVPLKTIDLPYNKNQVLYILTKNTRKKVRRQNFEGTIADYRTK